jgi:hypothetical protein
VPQDRIRLASIFGLDAIIMLTINNIQADDFLIRASIHSMPADISVVELSRSINANTLNQDLADFTKILSSFGKNFGIDGLGDFGKHGGNILPLPGVTETMQRTFLSKLGILDPDPTGKLLPSGNPNIIKQAKNRKLVGYGEAGSGLKATINIKMSVEYEQKFLSGIDPTIAWMDILNNALTFGTQNSDNYGLSSEFQATLKAWTGPNAVTIILDSLVDVLQDMLASVKDNISKLMKSVGSTFDSVLKKGPTTEEEKDEQKNEQINNNWKWI